MYAHNAARKSGSPGQLGIVDGANEAVQEALAEIAHVAVARVHLQ
jgi:hypothetical protein